MKKKKVDIEMKENENEVVDNAQTKEGEDMPMDTKEKQPV